MKKVYCIVATYNGLKWVEKCFRSLSDSDYPVSIIAVDDVSNDGTPEVIEKKFPDVKVIRQSINSGTRAANNIGVLNALKNDADYIFILNNDVWIENDTITNLIEVAEKNPDYGIISPMHLNGSNTRLDYLFSTYIEPQKCPDLYSDIYMDKLKDIYPIYNVNAAAWLVRKEVFEEIGLFDELFRMYGEDDNFVDRAKYFGFKIGVTPTTNIYHDREQRIPNINNFKTDYQKQIRRMKVIGLNPNYTTLDKIVLLFRKSMSDFIRNLKSLNILSGMKNITVLFYGMYFSIRYKNRHKELKNQIENSFDT